MVGEIFHICNRGFKKHNIFSDDRDRLRFVLNLYRLNNKNGYLRITERKDPFSNLPEQDKLVEVLKWNLMPNHYHLLLYEKVEGGVLEFVKRIGNAYTKYSNIKNESSGYVFQNSAKIVPFTKNPHYLYIPFYIDLNPLDLLPGWKTGKRTSKDSIKWLLNYEWSSYGDYFGKKSKFVTIVNTDLFYKEFSTDPKSYKKETLNFIRNQNFEDLKQHVNVAG